MSAWTEGLQSAIEYMEKNLTEEIQVKDIAEKAYVSEFHFQRIFSVLCGFSVAEYIRNRRLALAAKEKGAPLRDFAPLRIILSLEGGTMMDYRIEEKAAFTVMGRKRSFSVESAYQEIPMFWKEHMEDGGGEIVCGMFGLCIDSDGSDFDYLIADNYLPWKATPDGYETRTLPAGTWAVFPCKMKNLQDTNTKMWKEWLPNCKDYKLGGNYNIELYAPPCEEDFAESYCEIWLPIISGENLQLTV